MKDIRNLILSSHIKIITPINILLIILVRDSLVLMLVLIIMLINLVNLIIPEEYGYFIRLNNGKIGIKDKYIKVNNGFSNLRV